MTHDDYFEAIIQLRNPTLEVEEALIKGLKEEISKGVKVKGGADYYIKDQKKAQRVTKKLHKRFGGEFNISRSQYSRDSQTSKPIYRLNILLRLPDFKKGDVVKIDEKLIRITGLGKKVTGDNLRTGKKEAFDYDEDFEKLEPQETRVVQKKPVLKVLHPETYQAEELQNEPGKELQVNEKVEVVVDKGVWLV